MKTIKEIIDRLNYLEEKGAQIQQQKGDRYWLEEVSKYEDLFTMHPDADQTRMSDNYPWRWELKNKQNDQTGKN